MLEVTPDPLPSARILVVSIFAVSLFVSGIRQLFHQELAVEEEREEHKFHW